MPNDLQTALVGLCDDVLRGFGNINASLRAQDVVNAQQKTFNSRTTLFALATVACLLIFEKRTRKQEEKIKELTDEIEELKNQKGE